MPVSRSNDSLRSALLFVALVLLVRIAYLAWLCPYDLVEDEAHYWLWSRHLDWSYYSKGPGIAWVIWLSTRLFGHAEWAVRLPAAVAGAVGALACAGLARDLARRAFIGDGSVATPARAALFAAAAYTLAPAFMLTGLLVTIDGCYLACWALSCWAAWRALGEGSGRAWIGLGAALGLGFLFKYTILLLIPGVVLFAVLSAKRASRGRGAPLRPAAAWGRWMVAGLCVLALALAPVLIWNAREGWPTVKHLLGHLGLRGGDMPVPAGPGGGWSFDPLPVLEYLASPIGMFGPLLVLATVAAWRLLRRDRPSADDSPARERALGVRFLLWAFVPIFVFYLAVSFITEPELNWPIGGFVSLMVLAGWYTADELARRRAGAAHPELTGPDRPRTRPIKVLWRVGVIYGVVAALLIHFGPIAAGGLNALARTPMVSRAIESARGRPPGPIVLGRLIGSRAMAAHAGRVIDELRIAHPGSRPFLMCEHYGRASQMAYYLFRERRGEKDERADVVVLSPQSVMGGRKSQFDFWPDTSLSRNDLLGQPALLMSNDKPETVARWKEMFERVEPLPTDGHRLDGEHKKDRVAYMGYGYRGIDRGARRPPRPTRTPAATGTGVQQSSP